MYNSDLNGPVLSTMGGYTETKLVGTAPDASYYLFITEDVRVRTQLRNRFGLRQLKKQIV
jgi:hypothetical protein